MNSLQDSINKFVVDRLTFSGHVAIVKQVIEGDELTDVPDGNGGLLPSLRKLGKMLNDLALASILSVANKADEAAASAASALASANAASAAASGDALHANVFISPKVLTADLTILANENAIILHERIAQGVTLRVQGTVTITN